MVSEIWPGQDFKGQGKFKDAMARSKVRSRSHQDVAHLQFLINVTTKYQPSIPYKIQERAQIRFYRSRSLQQGQRSNQGYTMTLHTYTL